MDLKYFIDKIGLPEGAKSGVMEIYEALDFSPYEQARATMTADLNSFTAGYQALREAIGDTPDEHQRLTLTLELVIALTTYEKYKALGIPDRIFFDTMGVFSRYAKLYEESHGVWGFDRGHWVPRHLCMNVFRLGILEYEYGERVGKPCLAIHIPPSIPLTDETLNESFGMARAFTNKYYPERSHYEIMTQTWLVSPMLDYLLPEGSKILLFKSKFDIIRGEAGEGYALNFIFDRKDFKFDTDDIDSLPGETSLQRKVKELYKKGGRVGYGVGILKEDTLPAYEGEI